MKLHKLVKVAFLFSSYFLLIFFPHSFTLWVKVLKCTNHSVDQAGETQEDPAERALSCFVLEFYIEEDVVILCCASTERKVSIKLATKHPFK